MTPTEFLLSRIAEDVAAARAVGPDDGKAGEDGEAGPARHRARWSPARVLAECDAKRRIVELAHEATGYDMTVDLERDSSARAQSGVSFVGDRILKELATVYADHPDYDESWRP
ncbi:DUF6221 family protein [Cellulosimicrobium sp. Marseille-Q4280]|uniref:DUF6221 family protein n=1 Tax=Cellulosimicrobium sp. Marseille-Q4280 TaxID=2937992 RepID=UPI00203F0738|nr:DUF6221 family protein [Cellulosimicrobium sp. Marseille-Q4280]